VLIFTKIERNLRIIKKAIKKMQCSSTVLKQQLQLALENVLRTNYNYSEEKKTNKLLQCT